MSTEPVIRVDGVSRWFGSVVAVSDVSFDIGPGITGLLGPNGAGKTTAIRILATVLEPDAGDARILGHDVVLEPDAVRRRIGLAGQYAAVDQNLTGHENLRLIGMLSQMPSEDVGPRADELLARFDLTDAADRPVRTYSGGMRRRLDIAAALVAKPPVLFLDEPTTGLDLFSRNELWEMIRELVRDGTTVLLTTQYLEEADRLADRVAVIDHGHVIANDTPAALKAKLGDTVAELGFEVEEHAERAHALLDGVGATVERDGATVRLSSNEGPRVLIDVLRRLDGAGISPSTLAVHQPSLDDVFLALTGRRAEETVDGAEPQPAPGRRRRRAG